MRKLSAPTTGKEQNPTEPTMPINNNTNNNIAVRSKRAKTTLYEYDSSVFNHNSKRLRLQADMLSKQSSEEATCHECKKKSKADRFVNCVGQCSNKIHRSCLPQFGKKSKEQVYKCSDCHTCSICKTGFPDATKLLKCYLCFVCYHSGCYPLDSDQSIRIVKEKRFSCSSCQRVQVTSTPKSATRVVRNRVGRSTLHTVTEASDLETSEVGEFLGFSATDVPLLPAHRSKSVDCTASLRAASHSDRNTIEIAGMASRDHNNIVGMASRDHNNIVNDQRKLPNVIKWTHDEIYEYFKMLFPLHAHVFHDEEIDGAALYQLKREDVLCGFKLKVGPAIKIYEHILKMQTERGV